MELLKLLQKKVLKLLVFSITTFIGISKLWDAYLHLVLKSLFQFFVDQPQ